MTDGEKVQWLYDRARITDVVMRFAVALDSRDWALYQSCFTETVVFDYPASGGYRELKASDIVNTSPPFFDCFDATQHISANHQIDIDGDLAICISTLHAQHYRAGADGGPLQRQIGTYRNQLRREGDDWKIFHTEQQVRWSDGNQAMFEAALEERRRRIAAAAANDAVTAQQ